MLDPTTFEQSDTGVFPSDTAQTYTDEAATVDIDRAMRDVGSWPMRTDVALVHHGDQAVGLTAVERAELVCGADTYMEVVTVGPLELGQVQLLRIDKETWVEHNDLWWRWQENEVTEPAEVAKAMAWHALLAWEDDGMRIIVDDGQ